MSSGGSRFVLFVTFGLVTFLSKNTITAPLAKRFGLTPEYFAENLRDNYQRHEVDQEHVEPAEAAKEFLSR